MIAHAEVLTRTHTEASRRYTLSIYPSLHPPHPSSHTTPFTLFTPLHPIPLLHPSHPSLPITSKTPPSHPRVESSLLREQQDREYRESADADRRERLRREEVPFSLLSYQPSIQCPYLSSFIPQFLFITIHLQSSPSSNLK
jgi:hypothetical protein